ncbi:hypothetical protein GNI_129200 [Gregarina niphandrodes]|uniref:Uncharacterized protein n=1 Tax=Gregarina niphandrodes TaxID=110365 RepID=A0A023B1Y2_GRENI|nr:hypothetical protein GNI_129200 [Gregarina niphandrodes]EZG48335.1 hypothetical protein GNI_129200 [Gregarina niphandrodes]|eukprot:XP_011132105.1 hypothetical protein GNI_129200 [Gregarina niphandrodes]
MLLLLVRQIAHGIQKKINLRMIPGLPESELHKRKKKPKKPRRRNHASPSNALSNELQTTKEPAADSRPTTESQLSVLSQASEFSSLPSSGLRSAEELPSGAPESSEQTSGNLPLDVSEKNTAADDEANEDKGVEKAERILVTEHHVIEQSEQTDESNPRVKPEVIRPAVRRSYAQVLIKSKVNRSQVVTEPVSSETATADDAVSHPSGTEDVFQEPVSREEVADADELRSSTELRTVSDAHSTGPASSIFLSGDKLSEELSDGKRSHRKGSDGERSRRVETSEVRSSEASGRAETQSEQAAGSEEAEEELEPKPEAVQKPLAWGGAGIRRLTNSKRPGPERSEFLSEIRGTRKVPAGTQVSPPTDDDEIGQLATMARTASDFELFMATPGPSADEHFFILPLEDTENPMVSNLHPRFLN